MSSSSEESDHEVRPCPSKKVKTGSDPLSRTPLDISSQDTAVFKKPKQQPVIILLDQASLETVKNKRGIYELLNCDDHRDLCKKKLRKDSNLFRPDILHQELLALLDSPVNKGGLLKVYIQSTKNVLIDVHPSIRIPRTYKRFASLMVQLLHKMKIKAGNDSMTLLKMIKNLFSQHLPAGTRCFGFSCEGTLYSPIALAKTIVGLDPETSSTQRSGHITIEDHPYIEKMLSISSYPLSSAAALSRIMGGIEHHWGVV